MPDATFDQANARGAELREQGHALSARYDPAAGALQIKLSTGQMLTVPTRRVQGLADATPDTLREIRITPSGLGLYFPQLGVDVQIIGLRNGIYGTPNWMRRLAEAETGIGAALDQIERALGLPLTEVPATPPRKPKA